MAVSSGLYGVTLEKMLINTAAIDLEAETNKVALLTDSHTPDFTADATYADLDNEVPGTGNYTTGGQALTGTQITLASGILTYDATDSVWSTATIANAMAAVGYADAVGDELIFLSDFLTAANSSAGTFTVQWHASGIFTVDFVP